MTETNRNQSPFSDAEETFPAPQCTPAPDWLFSACEEDRYCPPYDSPIEDAFAWALSKYLREDFKLEKQVTVATFVGNFRLDFVAQSPHRKIAFECDGKDYHDYTRDMFRDSIILGCTDIESIYRFAGKDITYHLEDALYTLTTFDPSLFSQRGKLNLKQLATRDTEIFEGAEFLINRGNAELLPIWIRALRRNHSNQVWRRLFDYASLHRSLGLDELIRRSEQDQLSWFRDA